jgi:hypothetical protein
MNIGNLELDEQEKPVRPPKIRAIRIIENPFDDIIPRITREEREAQRKAKLEAKREAEVREKRSKAKKYATVIIELIVGIPDSCRLVTRRKYLSRRSL